ncbi:hypothetical protein PHMEG_00031639 [Phytophthora megakarya]|uniref:Uncharacterized protein n=1 Tax=Phytophthora megakarya TaxID=4795 RepID=A0A225UXM4_9STRA|nr:hypothetical protein PHMEG_00031639 [Phytophthora megakarya]
MTSGVRYVLCVSVGPDLAVAEYKLYTVVTRGLLSPQQSPRPVIAPASLVSFDARLLLGLDPRDALPARFPDPFTVDLYKILLSAQDGMEAV